MAKRYIVFMVNGDFEYCNTEADVNEFIEGLSTKPVVIKVSAAGREIDFSELIVNERIYYALDALEDD